MLLVFNSHLDRIYPIKEFATGGAIGNTIFFFISGYILLIGVSKRSFFDWYIDKAKRIYTYTNY